MNNVAEAPFTGRPHVVVLSTVLPVPQDGGQRRRAHELLTRLSPDYDISWLCSSRRFGEDAALAPALSGLTRRVIVRPAAEQSRATAPSSDRRGGGLRAVRRQLALPPPAPSAYVPPVPQHVASALSRELATDLRALLEAGPIDLIQVDAAMVPHLPTRLGVPLVVVEHPVHSELWEQRTEAAVHAEEARQCSRQVIASRRYEQATWRRARTVVAVAEEDVAVLHQRAPGLDVRLVPNGYDHTPDVALPDGQTIGADPASVIDTVNGHPTVVFAADLTDPVSADTALVLVRDVFPRVQNLIPHARLVLAGPLPNGWTALPAPARCAPARPAIEPRTATAPRRCRRDPRPGRRKQPGPRAGGTQRRPGPRRLHPGPARCRRDRPPGGRRLRRAADIRRRPRPATQGQQSPSRPAASGPPGHPRSADLE